MSASRTALVRRTLAAALLPGILGAVLLTGSAASAADAQSAPAASAVGIAPGAPLLWESDADLARDLDLMSSAGLGWVRLDFDWASIEDVRGRYDWANLDRVIAAARSRGLKVLGLPTYTPAWARPAGTDSHTPPTDPAAFAAFAGAAAGRYAPQGVHAYEIWNEPNLAAFWAPRPDPRAYARLLAPAAAAVRAADPSATVLSGGLSPAVDAADGGEIRPATFLTAVYDAGAGAAFDAVAVHPYSYPALATDVSTASWNTFQALPSIHQLMAAHGDGAKKIWLTEVGAPTGTSSDAVSEQKQADIVTSALRGATAWSWTGPTFLYSIRDSGTDRGDREQNFGLLRQDFTTKPSWRALTALLANAAPVPPSAPATPAASSPVAVAALATPVTARTAPATPDLPAVPPTPAAPLPSDAATDPLSSAPLVPGVVTAASAPTSPTTSTPVASAPLNSNEPASPPAGPSASTAAPATATTPAPFVGPVVSRPATTLAAADRVPFIGPVAPRHRPRLGHRVWSDAGLQSLLRRLGFFSR